MSDGRWLTGATDVERRALRQALDEAAPVASSDVRRQRVWIELTRAHTRHRLTRRAFAAGAVLASALTAGAFLIAGHWPRQPRAIDTGARVVASRTAARPELTLAPTPATKATATTPMSTPVSDAVELAPGSSVKTSAGERAVRRLASGARVEVQPAAALALDTAGRAFLQSGEARFDVPAQPAGRPFAVRIASYYVMVAGARFTSRFVARADAGGVQVTVKSGALEIWGAGRLLARLTAGGTWSHAVRAARSRTAAANLESPRAAVAARDDSPASDDPAAIADVADLTAAREAGASEPARAIAIYERIVARGGPAAENALYQIGSVYHDQLHDPARAVEAWERYRTRFPHGQLRAEADLSIFDALAERGQRARALDEGLAFLRRHPHSERRGEVARVAADLARERGQYRQAADLYAQVAGVRVSPDDADDAAFGRAACLDELDDEAARTALADYLATYPHGRHAAEARKLMAEP